LTARGCIPRYLHDGDLRHRNIIIIIIIKCHRVEETTLLLLDIPTVDF
jgi:hypothetical protein